MHFIFIFIFSYFLFIFLTSILAQNCERSIPIYKENSCSAVFCTKEEFNSSVCTIRNDIIKTQWLNNFMKFEESFLKYISFASFSNGDIILQAGTYPESNLRTFIGLQKNGRCLFKNKTSYFNSINASQDLNNYKKI